MKPIIFCDFDGTITRQDTTDAILETFADPAWRRVEERWVAGEIGSRECLREQMSLVQATSEELARLVDSIPIDPFFRQFVEACVARGFPFYVVSDGFDWVIHRALQRMERAGQSLEKKFRIAASSLVIHERFMITTFPHASVHCTHGCATCKPQIMQCEGRGYSPVVFIGDGHSDRHAVRCADLIFAKKSLLTFCGENSIPHIPFEGFEDLHFELDRRLQELEAQAALATKSLILSYETES